MKKKLLILIVIFLTLVIVGYFGYKGINLYIYVYSIENEEIWDGLVIEDTINVNTMKESDYITFNNINIKDDFESFELVKNDSSNIKYVLEEDDDTIFYISQGKFDFYDNVNNDEEWLHNILKDNNIGNDLDLINYLVNNKHKKPNIFSSIKEMKFYNYVYYLAIQSEFIEFESIKLIDGDYKGYILESKDMPIREINIIDGTDKYVISLWNKEFFTYEYIEELLNTIVIGKLDNTSENNDMDNFSEKSCTYTETYTFFDYYENEDLFFSDVTFNIILEKFQSKTGPVMLSLNSSDFNKDFIKGHNYEVTYNTTVYYSKGIFDSRTNVIKIVPTDKTGLGQVQENCILR